MTPARPEPGLLALRRPTSSAPGRLLTHILIAALLFALAPPHAIAATSIRLGPRTAEDLVHPSPTSSPRDVLVCGVVIAVVTPPGLTKSAFGELLAHTGTDPQPYAFTGEPLEPNSGWQYHRARWMDPTVGRFASVDPFEGLESDPSTLHRYTYASADPVNSVDPTGEVSLSGAITTVSVQVTLFTLSHPILTAVIGVVANAVIPEEVHNAMLSSGIPGLNAFGALGRAEGRGIRLIKNAASRQFLARELGMVSREAGFTFERLALRHLFKGAATEVPVGIGKFRIDMIWRSMMVELKSGRNFGKDDIEQLEVFAKVARSGNLPLIYVFLSDPGNGVARRIARAGGTAFYLFD